MRAIWLLEISNQTTKPIPTLYCHTHSFGFGDRWSGKSRRSDHKQGSQPKIYQNGMIILTICSRTVLWKICSRISGTSSSSSNPISMIRSIVNGRCCWNVTAYGSWLIRVQSLVRFLYVSRAIALTDAFSVGSRRKHARKPKWLIHAVRPIYIHVVCVNETSPIDKRIAIIRTAEQCSQFKQYARPHNQNHTPFNCEA